MDNIIACDYEPLNLLAQTNAPATSFLWSTDSDFDTNVGTDQSLTVQTSVQPITYWVQATDPHGCVAVASLAVQNAAIDLDFDNAFQTCNGYPAIIKVDAIDVSTFTNWQPFNPMETPLFEDGIFTFSVSNDLGCTGDGEVVVKVAEFTGTISADAEPEEIWAGQTTVLSVTTKPTYSYVWSPVLGLSDPFSANPVATPETSMTYTVEVTDEETGCRSNDEIEVKVKDIICDEPYIYLPNAFTPNGDGTNDILKVEGINVEEVYLTIYDRWGEKVFETASLDQGWDGSFRGQVVSGDVYGYYLTVRCPGGLEFFKKGNITVLR
jgi:gliding motility-associated-like protein